MALTPSLISKRSIAHCSSRAIVLDNKLASGAYQAVKKNKHIYGTRVANRYNTGTSPRNNLRNEECLHGRPFQGIISGGSEEMQEQCQLQSQEKSEAGC